MASLENAILAAVTLHPERVGGALPIFAATDEAEAQVLASSLAHILDAMVHDLGNGTLIVVRH